MLTTELLKFDFFFQCQLVYTVSQPDFCERKSGVLPSYYIYKYYIIYIKLAISIATFDVELLKKWGEILEACRFDDLEFSDFNNMTSTNEYKSVCMLWFYVFVISINGEWKYETDMERKGRLPLLPHVTTSTCSLPAVSLCQQIIHTNLVHLSQGLNTNSN